MARMPRNLSAWVDLTIHLMVMFVLVVALSFYNQFLAAGAFFVWFFLVWFARERCDYRARQLQRYCRDVVGSISGMVDFAVEHLPQAILILDKDGRIQWHNDQLKDYIGVIPESNTDIRDFWEDFPLEEIWGKSGETVFPNAETRYNIYHHVLKLAANQPDLMAVYVQDRSELEHLKQVHRDSRTVLIYIQVDNYDEVVAGLSEASRAAVLLGIHQQVDGWMKSLGGFIRRVNDDLYVVILERKMLDRAMEEKFDILDRVRKLSGVNRLPVTLSMGVAVADMQSMETLGAQAQAQLDLALGRGGDQVALLLGEKTHFFGGKTKAVEKLTRVKSRVVAHAMKEILEGAESVYVMGHHNEDFDCFGAAIGVAKMARYMEKPVHIVLSDMNDGIEKMIDLLGENAEYEGILLRGDEIPEKLPRGAVLFVVDTHIPHLVASPKLLEDSARVVVIDHHRRSETAIQSPMLMYHETATSSTCELVTELLMYFGEDLELGRVDATALYSGIVVDTKNFSIQTGVRTFDAASYLRRCGADPVMIRHLFRTDYETTVELARAKARSEYYEGGLIVTTCPDSIPNVQVIAGQTADGLLRIENVHMSVVLFQLPNQIVGISARSNGAMNVQVLMEKMGGGGHQNVAGAQVPNRTLEDVKAEVVELCKAAIKELEEEEKNLKMKELPKTALS